MEWKTLAIVQVLFHAQELDQDTLQTLEQFLRKQENVDNLIIHPQAIDFHIWSPDKIDYSILDGFKIILEKSGCSDFEIRAREYGANETQYFYADLEKQNRMSLEEADLDAQGPANPRLPDMTNKGDSDGPMGEIKR